MNISKENIDDLTAVIKLSIEKADYDKRVNDVLKDYRKKANMPGFRPGKVPTGLVKKMYGKAVLVEEVNKIVGEEIHKYIHENDLNVLGEPIPSEKQEVIDFDTQEDFSFTFDVAVAPEFEVKLSKREKYPYYNIEVDETMVQQQVDSHAGRLGSSEVVEVVAEKSMIKGNFIQVDADGNAVEEGLKAEEAVLSLHIVKDEDEKKKLVDAKTGAVIILDPKKAFTNATDIANVLKISNEEAEALEGNLQLSITEITEFVPSEINQELFDKVYGEGTVSTEEEFRAKIKEEIAGTLAMESNYRFSMDAKEKLMKKIGLSLPEAFLKRWIIAANQGKSEITPEQIEEEFPRFLEDMQWQLIKNKIIKDNELKIEEADVVVQAKQSARMQFMQYGLTNIPEEHLENYAADLLKNEEQRRNFAESAIQEKVIAHIKESVKIDEKEINREDFNKLFEKK